MSWLEKLKEYFKYKPEEKLGPKELPRDIVEDLLGKEYNETTEQQNMFGYQRKQDKHERSNETIYGEMHEMFREMDLIFKDFFSSSPNFNIDFSEPKDVPERGHQQESLREKMLDGKKNQIRKPFAEEERFSFFHHNPSTLFRGFFGFPFRNDRNFDQDSKQELDRDLDEQIKSGTSLDDIINDTLSDDNDRRNESLIPFDFFNSEKFFPADSDTTHTYKYSTVKKKINPDGSIEIQSSKRDSDGNEEVVVTRSIGDQTHEVTTKKNNKGEEEKTENLINMDADDLPKFEDDWNNKKNRTRRSDVLVPQSMQVVPGNEDWNNFFSSWRKPKL